MDDLPITFEGELWRWQGAAPAAWHFITLPKDAAARVGFLGSAAPGFGMVKVRARIGGTEFTTSVFPDKTSGSFLLPVKASVRKAEKLSAGDSVTVTLSV